jgi:hypothetical protein
MRLHRATSQVEGAVISDALHSSGIARGLPARQLLSRDPVLNRSEVLRPSGATVGHHRRRALGEWTMMVGPVIGIRPNGGGGAKNEEDGQSRGGPARHFVLLAQGAFVP